MNHRFGAVFRWNIEPSASDRETVQDAVEQPAANVQLRWREVFLNNLLDIIVNFPQCYNIKFYLIRLIILGSP